MVLSVVLKMTNYETHLFTYRHDGADWVLAIKATDADDARARIGKLAYATYDGVAIARLAIPPVTPRPMAALMQGLAAYFRSRFVLSRQRDRL